MSIYIIPTIVLLLIGFGVYKLFKNRSETLKYQKLLSEEDLKPFFCNIDLDKEERIRKQWLNSFLTLSGITIFFSLLNYFIGGSNELSERAGVVVSIMLGLFMLFLSLMGSWIMYHCAYKKKGTAWLMFTIISLPLLQILELILERTQPDWNQTAEWNSFGWFLMMAVLGLEVFFWISCIRLYKINSSRKRQTVLAFEAKYG